MYFRRFLFLGACLCLSLLPLAAEATIRPYSLALNPQAGAFFFEEGEDLKDVPLYSLGFGFQLSGNWSGKWSGAYLESRKETGQQQEVRGYLGSMEMLYHLRPDRDLVPHLAAGLGFLAFERGGSVSADGFAEYGVGLQYFFSPSWAFSLDGRHLFRENQNFTASAGLAFYLGGEVEEPLVTDGDGDGIIDVFDRCPETRLGVPVDGYGCPADLDGDGVADHQDKCADTPPAAAVDDSGCPRDSDRDGTADYLDACPETAAGAAVDAKGCPQARPLDSDGDGVEDTADRCPATPAGTSVDSGGCARSAEPPCPAPVVAETAPPPLELHLGFKTGEAAIEPGIAEELEKALRFIGEHPDHAILVEGHTDSVGSAESNLRLSQERAENIRSYLLQKTALPPERIRAQGYGGARPVADNGSQAGRAKNRRVVILLGENPGL